MKRILSISLIAAMALSFNACKKSNSTVDGTNFLGNTSHTTPVTPPVVDPLAPVGPLPTDYTKKVVLEEFTGEWCGWCPEGAKVMVDNLAAHPGKLIGIAIHDGDPMEIPSYNTWMQTLVGVTGFPNGTVDRADASDRGNWTSQINSELAKTANLGLAMVTTKKAGSDLVDIKVYIGYKTPITGAKLTVVLTEDKVPQSAGGQHNYSSSVVVDGNWTHSHVLRGIVTANDGDVVDLTSTKKYTIVEFKDVDMSTMKIKDYANVQVAAFINVNATPRDILNAQEVGLNATQKWD